MSIPQGLRSIAAALPCPLYLVGGYVRNLLLYGKTDTDMDICAALPVEELRRALEGLPCEVQDVNPRVGTVLIKWGDERYEYTTFRRDSYPIGGVHTPAQVTFVGSPAEDALRRDFCANAIYLDVATGEIIDPTGGREDLKKGVLRATREPDLVFGEDGLRILRLVRFCAQLGFVPDEETFLSAQRHCHYLRDITPERIWGEMRLILLSDTRYNVPFGHEKGLALLDRLGAWPYIAPLDAPCTTEGCLRYFPQDLTLRLAGLTRCLALQTGAERIDFAIRMLGRDGWRCSNTILNEVECLLRAEQASLYSEADWRIWAATYRENSERVGYLWNDAPKAKYAVETWHAIRDKHIPLSHKDLPLSPADLCRMGIPSKLLGKVYQAVLLYCWTHLLRPTKQRCTVLVRNAYKEKKWNR